MEEIQRLNRLKIIEIAHKTNECHLGSALSMVDLIEAIYQAKRIDDHFVLSAGHAAQALYAVMATHGLMNDAEIETLDNHPDRNQHRCIEVSTGSLGQGLPIAVGMALADREKRVYCCISDGECFEGSIWESIRVWVENKLANLIVAVNSNRLSAYRDTNPLMIKRMCHALGARVKHVDGHELSLIKEAIDGIKKHPTLILAETKVDHLPFLSGLGAHYHKMSQDDYDLAVKLWACK